MLAWRRRSTAFFLGPLAISAACGTIQVPFEPTDGSGGNGASPSGGGTTTGGTASVGGSDTGGATLGGSGGTNDDGAYPGFGAMGGMGGYVGDLLVSAGSTIRGIAATQTHVYWLEYGTFDALDNYQFDGAFLRMELDSGDVDIIAEQLEGPVQVEITTSEAFILLERSTTIDPDGDRALVRIPLAGGPLASMEHEGAYDYGFTMASFEDRAYVPVRLGGEWSIREYGPESEAGELVLPDHPMSHMAADETHLYFTHSSEGGFWRQAVTGEGTPEALSGADYPNLALETERVLTTRGQTPMYLAAMPKDGGAWSNIVSLGSQYACDDLVVHGSLFFAQCMTAAAAPYLIRGRWDGTEPLTSHSLTDEEAWASTEADLFIGRGEELYRVRLE